MISNQLNMIFFKIGVTLNIPLTNSIINSVIYIYTQPTRALSISKLHILYYYSRILLTAISSKYRPSKSLGYAFKTF